MQGSDVALVRLAERGAQFRAARDTATRASAHLAAAVRSAHDAGISEHRIAETAGVTRVTVRRMLGKG